jgi:hypothetical protein
VDAAAKALAAFNKVRWLWWLGKEGGLDALLPAPTVVSLRDWAGGGILMKLKA